MGASNTLALSAHVLGFAQQNNCAIKFTQTVGERLKNLGEDWTNTGGVFGGVVEAD